MDICCDGVVIRETAYGESDKILTLLTDKLGKITVSAKGVRSIKSKNSSGVQLFANSSFELTEKNGRYTLKTAILQNSFYALRDDVTRFALGSYIVDVAATVCTENNDETEMLRLVKNCLYAIAEFDEVPLWKIKAAFELKCMTANGFAPDLSCCAECGCEADENKDGVLMFSPYDGGFLCERCAEGREEKAFVPVSCASLEALEYIISSPQSKMLRFPADDEKTKNEICAICERYLIYQTARRYDTLAFYKSICAM
ncbi:MAG: DNA repair protein RecO [Clostridia bacterium]|nr:DNA repair protein RecO [Clostridia bacterium]